jgi:hypothetical protein
VKWEGAILTQELYDAEAQNTRFIPVLFSSEYLQHIPVVLKGQTYYDVSTDNGYEALYRHLTNQPLTLKPTLGRLKSMSPLKAVQSVEDKYEYDVFLSFAGADEELVKPLWQQLSMSGLRVFWSDEIMKQNVGKSFFEVIQNALEKSRHFVLFCTDYAMQSGWVKVE